MLNWSYPYSNGWVLMGFVMVCKLFNIRPVANIPKITISDIVYCHLMMKFSVVNCMHEASAYFR